MKLVYNKSLPPSYIYSIKTIFPDIVLLPFCGKDVYNSIINHPDIFISRITHDKFVCAQNINSEYVDAIKDSNIECLYSRKNPSGGYPDTCILNCVAIGKYLFHNLKYTDESIKTLGKSLYLTFSDINQGYSRCSIVPIGSAGAITEDKGIFKTMLKTSIEPLLITGGQVTLPGEKTGFIGGSAGILPDNSVFFVGDITKHTDYSKISTFFNL